RWPCTAWGVRWRGWSGSTRGTILPASGSTSGCRRSSAWPRSRSSSGGSSSTRAGTVRRSSGRRARSRRGRRWPSRRAASARVVSLPAMHVRELELDLDAFEGPFDLLLTLVLREELEPRDVDVADVVITCVERLALGTGGAGAAPPGDGGFAAVASSAEREQLELDACGEFLVLVGALLELKARELFPEEQVELSDLDPEEAAEEL